MTILFAYDGSEDADAAILGASKLLARDDADVVVLTIWEPLTLELLQASAWLAPTVDVAELDEDTERHARLVAERGVQLAREQGFGSRAVWVADTYGIAEAIVERAEELDADLIVLGARGLAGVRAWLGSVSNHVLQHAHRPVMVIPAGRGSPRKPR
jgi:nucleotide-binding universal stress UspA family protein